MRTKKLSPIFFILFLLWLGAVVFASIYDLEFSLAVADENSVFGRILEIAGEPPAILFTSFNFALISAYFFKKPSHRILAVLSEIVTVGTSIFTFTKIKGYLVDYSIIENSIGFTLTAVIIAATVSALFIAVTLKMPKESLERYFDTACRCALVGVATFVIIWLFKLTWGRVRFRQGGSDPEIFTPWYLPQGFTGYYSFPSGHTANATVILTVTFYFRFMSEKARRFKPIIITLLAVWLVAVALSRVLIGAHFLSDVLFGAAITLAIIYFAKGKDKNVH